MPGWDWQIPVAFTVCMLAISPVGLLAEQPTSAPALSQRIFIYGGAEGIKDFKTPWPDSVVRWVVKSSAGTIASGRLGSDSKGNIAPRFVVPKVRTAVKLALIVTAGGRPASGAHTVDVVVLPKDPFANVRETFGRLGIGLLPSGPLAAVLKRSGLPHTVLSNDITRGMFKGKVVILGGLLVGSIDVTDDWLKTLDPGTCLIVANCNGGKTSGFSVIKYLAKCKLPKQTVSFIDRRSELWTHLPPAWFQWADEAYKFSELKGLILLHVLAGRVTQDGSIFPLAIETRDIGGRYWLICSLSEIPAEDDPRWDLLLRNSLLWAHDHILAEKRQED